MNLYCIFVLSFSLLKLFMLNLCMFILVLENIDSNKCNFLVLDSNNHKILIRKIVLIISKSYFKSKFEYFSVF